MDRNTRTLVVLLVAIAMAGVASYGVYIAVRSIPERRVEIATAHAVVAIRPLPVGTLVTKDDLKWRPGPRPDGARLVHEHRPGGEPRPRRFGRRERAAHGDEAGQGGHGRRAPADHHRGHARDLSRVNEVIGVAGFVVPGNRVDVLVSIKQSEDTAHASRRGQRPGAHRRDALRPGEAQKEGKPIPTTVVTLLVTPEDAEKIALAADEGRIMLTLRNPLDQRADASVGVRRAQLLGGAASPPPVVRVV